MTQGIVAPGVGLGEGRSISTPMLLRQVFKAASNVVPVPTNGSRIVSPARD